MKFLRSFCRKKPRLIVECKHGNGEGCKPCVEDIEARVAEQIANAALMRAFKAKYFESQARPEVADVARAGVAERLKGNAEAEAIFAALNTYLDGVALRVNTKVKDIVASVAAQETNQ